MNDLSMIKTAIGNRIKEIKNTGKQSFKGELHMLQIQHNYYIDLGI